jgi:polygalacturonase
MKSFRLVLLLLPLVLSPFLGAQDTRTVTEPVIPPACATLDAQLQTSGSTLAEADETKLDTARIQKAIDHCGKGRGVLLRAQGAANAFLSGPLILSNGVTLIVDKGATLFASRDASLYEDYGLEKDPVLSPNNQAVKHSSRFEAPPVCGTVSESGHGCRPLITADRVIGAGVMGDGVIDGRGGEKILGSKFSWWDLAEQARAGGHQQVPRIIVASYAGNFTLYRITLKNSPNFHVVYNHGNGFTVWGLKIDTPQRLARNTDGVDPGNGSKNITITHSFIRTGDDNVAIKGGPGGVTNMTVSHNHFYWGHGMSIGSETDGGVSAIRVFDLSLDGSDNGIRIKSNGSRGGLTHDVVYDDVCVRDSPNPITLDTGYTAAGTVKGNSPPTMRDITLHNVRVSGGGKISFNGYDQDHRIAATLDGVLLTDSAAYTYSLNHADIHLGPGPTNLQFPAGNDSTIQGIATAGTPATGNFASCVDKFVPFP